MHVGNGPKVLTPGCQHRERVARACSGIPSLGPWNNGAMTSQDEGAGCLPCMTSKGSRWLGAVGFYCLGPVYCRGVQTKGHRPAIWISHQRLDHSAPERGASSPRYCKFEPSGAFRGCRACRQDLSSEIGLPGNVDVGTTARSCKIGPFSG